MGAVSTHKNHYRDVITGEHMSSCKSKATLLLRNKVFSMDMKSTVLQKDIDTFMD